VFDCPYEVARERLASSGKKLDRFEREDRAFFERVRGAYLSRVRAEPGRMRVIDAAADVTAIRKRLGEALAF
jgi:dTMP kinase